MMRLNKYLAASGVASRRAAEKIIQAGRVTVNGKRVVDLATTVDETRDVVRVDGKVVRPAAKYVYVLLNKPKGYITTANDERGRKTVYDLVRVRERIFPVGRLDAGSEGLLLLTNHGEMAYRLMHPKFKVVKTYRVKLDRDFDPKDFLPLTEGIELEEGTTAPCQASYYTDRADRVEIRIREGKYRQVRRMFEALGYEVKALKRIQFGPLHLNRLPRGKWRYLTVAEIRQLRGATGLEEEKTKERER